MYLDGGGRRGLDAFIALALGADAVFLGRLIAYELATGGEGAVLALVDDLVTNPGVSHRSRGGSVTVV